LAEKLVAKQDPPITPSPTLPLFFSHRAPFQINFVDSSCEPQKPDPMSRGNLILLVICILAIAIGTAIFLEATLGYTFSYLVISDELSLEDLNFLAQYPKGLIYHYS
jgi:hypothetical protein